MTFEKQDTRKVVAIVLAVAVLIVVGAVASFSARYAHTEGDDRAVASEAFYFTSDVLTSDGATYTLPAGTSTISFAVRNYADELRWSEGTVQYGWTCTERDGKSSEQKGSGSIASSAGGGTSTTINVNDLRAGTYDVELKATSPYTQTLKGTFVIPDADTAVSSTVEDAKDSATATLVVSTKDYEGKVTVTWPAGVIPDTTQEAFKDATAGADGAAGGSITVDAKRFSSYSFRFFKTNTSADYSGGNQISAAAQ